MKKDLLDNIKAVSEGKLVMSTEERLEMVREGYEMLVDDSITVGKLMGQADTLIAGGKGLIVAGSVWLLIGKLSRIMAEKIAEQYKDY